MRILPPTFLAPRSRGSSGLAIERIRCIIKPDGTQVVDRPDDDLAPSRAAFISTSGLNGRTDTTTEDTHAKRVHSMPSAVDTLVREFCCPAATRSPHPVGKTVDVQELQNPVRLRSSQVVRIKIASGVGTMLLPLDAMGTMASPRLAIDIASAASNRAKNVAVSLNIYSRRRVFEL
ncbi:hypothetical protein CPB85DRAFT_167043 [Mucidula mucida]|nr:hypothetical protein CPB85DRAFT_167043 [Mucidula mucida]